VIVALERTHEARPVAVAVRLALSEGDLALEATDRGVVRELDSRRGDRLATDLGVALDEHVGISLTVGQEFVDRGDRRCGTCRLWGRVRPGHLVVPLAHLGL
jgi:hypothetical protein